MWHLFPNPKRVVAYTSPTQSVTLDAEEELDGDGLLPGLRCKVSDLFDLD